MTYHKNLRTNLPLTELLTRDFLHILELAAKANVTLEVCGRCGTDNSYADPTRRVVHVSPLTDDRAYAVALHELGHLCDPQGVQTCFFRSRDLDVVNAEEQAAWAWAREHATRWTPAMEHAKQWSLSTYQQQAA